jgi:hypothetical protein
MHKRIPEHETLEGMLSAGKLDALVTVSRRAFLAGSPDVQRLFPNYREVELITSGAPAFSIMHLVVIRRDTYEEPLDSVSMVEAFERAKQVGRARMLSGRLRGQPTVAERRDEGRRQPLWRRRLSTASRRIGKY